MFILPLVIIAHTPQEFYYACPTETIQLDNIDVSSVTYMTMWPYCNYSFEVEGQNNNFEVLSLHRFKSTNPTASIKINNGTVYTENQEDKTGEPFTLTPVVTTLKLEQIVTKKFTVSDTKHGILTLVMGKSEDWWLFATIPYYSARIQWQWAYRQWDFWFWGVAVLVALLLTWPKRPAIMHSIAIFAWVCISDLLVPIASLLSVVHWPKSGFFNGLLAAKIVFLILHAYVISKFEIARRGRNGPYFNTLRITPLLVLVFLIIWLISIGLSIGSYVLQPVMLKRYTSRLSIHTSKRGYRVVSTTT